MVVLLRRDQYLILLLWHLTVECAKCLIFWRGESFLISSILKRDDYAAEGFFPVPTEGLLIAFEMDDFGQGLLAT